MPTALPTGPRARTLPRLALALLLPLAACADAVPVTTPSEPARVTAAVAGSAATTAPSASPRAYAYVENVGASGYVTNASTYNPRGSVWLERTGVGSYRLELSGQGYQTNGYPHVQVKPVRRSSTAFGSDFCGHWARPVNGSLHVDVRCTRGTAATDMPFVVQLFDGSAAVAYVSISRPGQWGFDRHVSRAQRVGRGQYQVFFRKDPLFSSGALPAAFVSWGTANVGCQIARLGSAGEQPGELGVEVLCRDRMGREEDQEVHVLAVAQAARTGYAFVSGSPLAPVPERSYNASGASVMVTPTGTGTAVVTFNTLGNSWLDNGTATATAVSATHASCAVDWWGRALRPGPVSSTNRVWSVQVAVRCWGRYGEPMTTPFTVLALPRP